jgi:hypothetical protein
MSIADGRSTGCAKIVTTNRLIEIHTLVRHNSASGGTVRANAPD